MGRKRDTIDDRKLPPGVTIRKHALSNSIQICFTFRNVKCRESLRLEPTQSNLRFASGLRGEIINKIEKDNFVYTDYFPDSKRAKIFGHVASNKTIGALLITQAEIYERATLNGKLSPSTLNGYLKSIHKQLIPAFGDLLLPALTSAIIRDWVSKKNNVTAKRIRNVLTPLRSVLDDAIEDGLIENTPFSKINFRKLLHRTTKKSDYNVEPFNEFEVTLILQSATGQIRNLFQFLFWSGLRPSELLALEWNHIDWKNGLIFVRGAIVEDQAKDTKTPAGARNIVLLPAARAALLDQKNYTFEGGGKIFQNPQTGLPWATDKQIRCRAWTPLLKQAGVRYRNPYQTRHTYASTLLSRGENPWWVCTQMGHVDVSMIFKHYGKWIPDNKKGGASNQPLNDWNVEYTFCAPEITDALTIQAP